MPDPTPSYRHMNALNPGERRATGGMAHGIIGVAHTEIERECRVALFNAFWGWVVEDVGRFRRHVIRGYF